MSLHPDFFVGDRVRVKKEQIGTDTDLFGEIVGVSSRHIISIYIVLLDEPILPPNENVPWKAITAPGVILERI